MALVNEMRRRGLQVPNVDPRDGGAKARALLLFESPGPKSIRSGFISRENSDPSARNVTEALARSGLERRDVMLWNVVPYCVSTAEFNRNATYRDVINAAPDTQAFIDAFLDLRVVVFCGGVAKSAIKHLNFPARVTIKETYHTGAQAYNHERIRRHIWTTFKEVADIVRAPS